ncbi:hypothetical protein [Cellulomonas fimi]|uniref:Uncharacterized protein n=1 Tax=Cellulomonas fimi (strain ATCC 484 / DSM 20113 / JCM 1341 / CCUG 24087 / LMG 16345 / NBRC 15513 / NCIMB 8980 / NCTC 7547 / NRS-133) TaxID=590998 RepID=F4GZP0_CELFA|nr:hypothetical protein [Cellulomonas fimi]AEE46084.1 hypothetical protein Celf_1954 [Cellulomonas fimi ATCC 484]NNH06935.1 hypothetical protein [Cellulomonas fimi]VEH31565.1 Uncharacterised protein [Cellulomonas fimi]
MLWFAVWTVIVLGTLAGAFVVARRLWRSGLAFVRQLATAAEMTGLLAQRVEELRALAAQSAVPTGPTLFADRGPLRERRDALREERDARRAERALRHRATRLSWRAYWR